MEDLVPDEARADVNVGVEGTAQDAVASYMLGVVWVMDQRNAPAHTSIGDLPAEVVQRIQSFLPPPHILDWRVWDDLRPRWFGRVGDGRRRPGFEQEPVITSMWYWSMWDDCTVDDANGDPQPAICPPVAARPAPGLQSSCCGMCAGAVPPHTLFDASCSCGNTHCYEYSPNADYPGSLTYVLCGMYRCYTEECCTHDCTEAARDDNPIRPNMHEHKGYCFLTPFLCHCLAGRAVSPQKRAKNCCCLWLLLPLILLMDLLQFIASILFVTFIFAACAAILVLVAALFLALVILCSPCLLMSFISDYIEKN
eukprot:TRINITY_DN6960_c0_g1_i1.p1 TRINITY_DN6960_c0_g1~~TRINITY_DN6960_c0_g1_i1.p1  ORF type:complete len:310 (+),score=36.70 TRINITY_DN6960_c0_g1_i1:208-1137(+)